MYKYLAVVLFALAFSLAFFSCSSNDDDNDTDTLYVNDTIRLTDTLYFPDTIFVDRVDTFQITDTLFNYDTTFINDTIIDTVEVTSNTILYMKPSVAFDPGLGSKNSSIIITDIAPDSFTINANISSLDGSIIRELDVTSYGNFNEIFWDGLIDDAPAPEGVYILYAELMNNEMEIINSYTDTIHLVTIGMLKATFNNDVDYVFHRKNRTQREYVFIDDTVSHIIRGNGESLHSDGNRLRIEQPWNNTTYPPFDLFGTTNYNLPVIYTIGTNIELELDIYSTYTPQIIIRDDTLTGNNVTVDLGNHANSRIGTELIQVEIEYLVNIDGEYISVCGNETLPIKIFTIYDDPILIDGTSYDCAPALPWLDVVALSTAIAHNAEDEIEIATSLRNYLYYDMGFWYSGRNYTHYDGPYTSWDRIYLRLEDFLNQSDGRTLYCHDVACGLTTLAGNIGVDLPYYYLGITFSTYYIRGIGHTDWTTHGWTAHSVNSLDGGIRVFDACLNLDGSDEPWTTPHEDYDVNNLQLEEYLEKLSAAPPSIQHWGYPYVE